MARGSLLVLAFLLLCVAASFHPHESDTGADDLQEWDLTRARSNSVLGENPLARQSSVASSREGVVDGGFVASQQQQGASSHQEIFPEIEMALSPSETPAPIFPLYRGWTRASGTWLPMKVGDTTLLMKLDTGSNFVVAHGEGGYSEHSLRRDMVRFTRNIREFTYNDASPEHGPLGGVLPVPDDVEEGQVSKIEFGNSVMETVPSVVASIELMPDAPKVAGRWLAIDGPFPLDIALKEQTYEQIQEAQCRAKRKVEKAARQAAAKQQQWMQVDDGGVPTTTTATATTELSLAPTPLMAESLSISQQQQQQHGSDDFFSGDLLGGHSALHASYHSDDDDDDDDDDDECEPSENNAMYDGIFGMGKPKSADHLSIASIMRHFKVNKYCIAMRRSNTASDVVVQTAAGSRSRDEEWRNLPSGFLMLRTPKALPKASLPIDNSKGPMLVEVDSLELTTRTAKAKHTKQICQAGPAQKCFIVPDTGAGPVMLNAQWEPTGGSQLLSVGASFGGGEHDLAVRLQDTLYESVNSDQENPDDPGVRYLADGLPANEILFPEVFFEKYGVCVEWKADLSEPAFLHLYDKAVMDLDPSDPAGAEDRALWELLFPCCYLGMPKRCPPAEAKLCPRLPGVQDAALNQAKTRPSKRW
eukprot:gnl/Hemi2/26773_TR9007_c0_g1_i2.p1 gnl/Hemi2/26773_TR9007_c0_g1~~gnl/Hemi2/26773_TR9007_c0_g1_i2.p1  ORF type:complete len:645 (+),score=213.66 gnl/Hemi2/26773_TR9007_c0_g1_i2:57-1991(+)